MRQILWVLLVTGMTGAAADAAAAQTVVRQPPPLDSARAALRHDLVSLRDSLSTVHGAAARLQRDYRTASEASLISRARLMNEACARSSRTVPPTRQAITDVSLSDRRKLQHRQDVVSALDSLQAALRRCETEFAAMSRPSQGERVRGYANHRAGQVQRAIRVYEQQLLPFLGAMGIRILPRGAGARSAAR